MMADKDTIDKTESKQISRIFSIDILRGYAVLTMILFHYYFLLKFDTLETNQFLTWVVQTQGGISLPIFSIVMGVALVLSIEKRKSNGLSYRDNLIHVGKRAILFFAINHIQVFSRFIYFGVLVFQVGGIYPTIIPGLGLSALICFFLLDLKKIYRILIMSGLEILWLLQITPDPFFDYAYLFYMIFGTLIGNFIIDASNKGKMEILLKKLLITGIILFSLGIPALIYTLSIYVPKLLEGTLEQIYWIAPTFMIYVVGAFTLTFSILFWIYDHKRRELKALQPFIIFSTLSLTIYYFHNIIRMNFFMPFGWANQFSVYALIIILLIFYGFLYLFGLLWGRLEKYKYSIEWLIRKLS